MKIDILATGSTGNVTLVNGSCLIDCGMPFRWIVNRLQGHLPDAVFITHEHGDHSKAVKQLIRRNVDAFMTDGTRNALRLAGNIFNLHVIKADTTFHACGLAITPIESVHDAAEPVNFILQDDSDRVLFVTDTGAIPNVSGNFTQIFIEANYDSWALAQSDCPYSQKERVMSNHLANHLARDFVAKFPDADVTFIHQSKRHNGADIFFKPHEEVLFHG